MYDIAIIGKGPAGISASLYAKRAGMSTAVIASGFGALERAEKIENFYGFEKPVSGTELLKAGIRQAKNLGVEFFDAEVLNVSWDGNFTVEGKNLSCQAKAVILANGAARRTGAVKNLSAFEGKSVSYCAVCDAFFYRNKIAAVLGNGEYALHELSALINLASKTLLFTDGLPPETTFPSQTEIITEKIVKAEGGERISGFTLANGETVPFDGLFVALGQAGADALAKKLGAKTENGKIVTDQEKATNIPGLFAAGDCTGGLMQISKAVSDGAIAATSAIRFVKNAK